jgi:hypothetical protein
MTIKSTLFTGALALATALSASATEKLIVVNEGSWNQNNSRLSYFEDGAVVSNDWYAEVNGTYLGDTPNDIIQLNDNLIAIALNSSNIVQFITPEGKAVAATENVPNIRHFATDGSYLYVSSYANECGTVNGTVTFTKGYVAKIDIATYQVVAACEVGYEPDGIAYYDGYLFVGNSGGYAYTGSHDYETTVSVIKADDMTKVKDIDTAQPNLYGKFAQSGKYLCIPSVGDYSTASAATIILDCEAALKGDDNCFTKIDKAGTYASTALDGTFYAIGSTFSYVTYTNEYNVMTIDPAKVREGNGEGISETLPGTIAEDIKNITAAYGFYVNPYTGYIYATDASTYSDAGSLYQWTADGTFVNKYDVYICPSYMLALNDNNGGINAATVSGEATPVAYYNLQGVRLSAPQNGINIVRMSDGSTRKVAVK